MGVGYFNDDTIVAIATSPDAYAALGVIRISGPLAWSVASQMLRKHSGESFSETRIESHRLQRCLVVRRDGSHMDDGLFVWMKSPHSFTGEDVIELHLHGNPLLLNSITGEALAHGARNALPGEFSFRAFQNGKISLSQAESISDLISSKTPLAAEWALEHLLGRSKGALLELKERIAHSLAQVEVDIDFSDQGVSVIDYNALADGLSRWCLDVEQFRKAFLDSVPLREGIKLALVGAPNSGKSSLFNQLLFEDRSIVSEEAGTTRDVVRESLTISGLVFQISDTAGLRSAPNSIEAQGIDRSYGELRTADMALWVIDGSQETGSALGDIRTRWKNLREQSHGHFLLVWNKSDLSPDISRDWQDFLKESGLSFATLSAKTGAGLTDLKAKIIAYFQSQERDGTSFLVGRMRHYEVLGKAVHAVEAAIQKVRDGETLPDLLSSDLREALSCLGEISGDFTNEDLLGHIFSKFCIGK